MKPIRTLGRRRGVTFVELVIVSAIMLLVGLAAASTMVAAARHTYSMLDLKQTEARGLIIMESIRKEILVGQSGTVRIEADGDTIVYFDPVRRINSGFAYNSGDRELYYFTDFDADEDPTRTWTGVSDITFSVNPSNDFLVLGERPIGEDTANLVRVTVALEPRLQVNEGRGVRIDNLVQVRNRF